jgi:NAD(P)-dependent dehydrogenase (short-subunit alcohol dehydrogenase family)
MSRSLILQGKRAVVFGGGGSIGAAVAKELASEGAEVFLAGRSATSVQAVAKEIEAVGGRAHADVIDALDGAAVEEYLESVVQQTGGLDIEFNATGPRVSEYANGKLAVDLPIDEFMVPVETVTCPQGRISSSWTPVQDAGKALIKVKFSKDAIVRLAPAGPPVRERLGAA